MSHSGWHRIDIRAAVEKKGIERDGVSMSLARLARSRGIHPLACRHAVVLRHIPGEQAIADYIGVPLWELWPDRWEPPARPGGAARRIDNRQKKTKRDRVRAKGA